MRGNAMSQPDTSSASDPRVDVGAGTASVASGTVGRRLTSPGLQAALAHVVVGKAGPLASAVNTAQADHDSEERGAGTGRAGGLQCRSDVPMKLDVLVLTLQKVRYASKDSGTSSS
jgi:hypothetical protein